MMPLLLTEVFLFIQSRKDLVAFLLVSRRCLAVAHAASSFPLSLKVSAQIALLPRFPALAARLPAKQVDWNNPIFNRKMALTSCKHPRLVPPDFRHNITELHKVCALEDFDCNEFPALQRVVFRFVGRDSEQNESASLIARLPDVVNALPPAVAVTIDASGLMVSGTSPSFLLNTMHIGSIARRASVVLPTRTFEDDFVFFPEAFYDELRAKTPDCVSLCIKDQYFVAQAVAERKVVLMGNSPFEVSTELLMDSRFRAVWTLYNMTSIFSSRNESPATFSISPTTSSIDMTGCDIRQLTLTHTEFEQAVAVRLPAKIDTLRVSKCRNVEIEVSELQLRNLSANCTISGNRKMRLPRTLTSLIFFPPSGSGVELEGVALRVLETDVFFAAREIATSVTLLVSKGNIGMKGHCVGVKELLLSACTISQDLRGMRQLTSLSLLAVSGRVETEGVKTIDIESTEITSVGGVESVETVRCTGEEATESVVGQLSGLTALRRLDVKDAMVECTFALAASVSKMRVKRSNVVGAIKNLSTSGLRSIEIIESRGEIECTLPVSVEDVKVRHGERPGHLEIRNLEELEHVREKQKRKIRKEIEEINESAARNTETVRQEDCVVC